MRTKVAIAYSIAVAAVVMAAGIGLVWNAPDSPPPETLQADTTTGGTEFDFPMLDSPKDVPELQFVDGDGQGMTLAAFKGKTVLLNIWATWCAPCREEMPALDRVQASLGGADFQVVALSIDRGGLSVVRDFYRELDLQVLDIYVDQTGDAARRLGIVGVPTTLLIGPSGRELGRLPGPAAWDSGPVKRFIGSLLLLSTGGDCDCPMGQECAMGKP